MRQSGPSLLVSVQVQVQTNPLLGERLQTKGILYSLFTSYQACLRLSSLLFTLVEAFQIERIICWHWSYNYRASAVTPVRGLHCYIMAIRQKSAKESRRKKLRKGVDYCGRTITSTIGSLLHTDNIFLVV